MVCASYLTLSSKTLIRSETIKINFYIQACCFSDKSVHFSTFEIDYLVNASATPFIKTVFQHFFKKTLNLARRRRRYETVCNSISPREVEVGVLKVLLVASEV